MCPITVLCYTPRYGLVFAKIFQALAGLQESEACVVGWAVMEQYDKKARNWPKKRSFVSDFVILFIFFSDEVQNDVA